MGVSLKFIKKKVKGSDCDLRTVVLQVFVSQNIYFILLLIIAWLLVQFGNTSLTDSCNFGVIEKLTRVW